MRNKTAEALAYFVVIIAVLVIIIPLTLVILISMSDWKEFQKNLFSVFETGPVW